MFKIKLWSIFKIFLIVFTGYFLALAIFCFCQGPDGAYDLGDGYQLNRWPGKLLDYTYWKSEELRDQQVTLEDRVTAYCVRTPWIIGKTERDKWFVIQKEKHEIHYPIEKLDEAEKIAGLEIRESDLITDPVFFWFPRYEVIQPHTKWAVGIFSFTYIAVVLLIYKIKRKSRNYEMKVTTKDVSFLSEVSDSLKKTGFLVIYISYRGGAGAEDYFLVSSDVELKEVISKVKPWDSVSVFMDEAIPINGKARASLQDRTLSMLSKLQADDSDECVIAVRKESNHLRLIYKDDYQALLSAMEVKQWFIKNRGALVLVFPPPWNNDKVLEAVGK